MSEWKPIETAPRDIKAMFWIRPSTIEDGKYFTDTSGKPIIVCAEPQLHIGGYGTWSSLWVATHWMPLPSGPVSEGDGT